MLRRPTFWFVTLAICVGMVLFRIKYEVIALEQHNKRIKKEILANKDAIHHLKAEWTYLNDPKRLQASAKNHLRELNPIKSAQLITFQDMAGSLTSTQTESNHKNQKQSTLDAYIADFTTDTAEGVDA